MPFSEHSEANGDTTISHDSGSCFRKKRSYEHKIGNVVAKFLEYFSYALGVANKIHSTEYILFPEVDVDVTMRPLDTFVNRCTKLLPIT